VSTLTVDIITFTGGVFGLLVAVPVWAAIVGQSIFRDNNRDWWIDAAMLALVALLACLLVLVGGVNLFGSE
jgi:hypothetical protein